MLVFALFMLAGGLMGYRAGSKASLIAGSISGLAMLLAWLVSNTNEPAGIWAGAVIALVLSATFARRLVSTKKLMPSGLLLLVSVLTCGVLVYFAVIA
jgi:uncharacterized membrane protein (UPF0136 family)